MDLAIRQIPRSTERISSYKNFSSGGQKCLITIEIHIVAYSGMCCMLGYCSYKVYLSFNVFLQICSRPIRPVVHIGVAMLHWTDLRCLPSLRQNVNVPVGYVTDLLTSLIANYHVCVVVNEDDPFFLLLSSSYYSTFPPKVAFASLHWKQARST